MNREKSLEEALASTIAGALIAIIFVVLIPEMKQNWELVVYFLLYWMMWTLAVWEIIDLIDYLRNGAEE